MRRAESSPEELKDSESGQSPLPMSYSTILVTVLSST